MGSPKLLLAAIAVLAVAGVAYLLGSGGDAASVEPTEPTTNSATEQLPVNAPSIESANETAAEEAAATRATVEGVTNPTASDDASAGKSMSCDVTGRVVDEAGRPLAGVEVAISTLGDMVIVESNGQRQGPREKAAKTGSDGRFTLKDVVPGFGTSVRAAPAGLVAVNKPLDRRDGGTLDVGDLVCEVGGTLVGRVVSDTGAPIAGAEVRAWTMERATGGEVGLIVLGDSGGANSQRVLTDGSGAFRFTGMKPGEAVVAASAEGFTRESTKGIAVKKGETTPEIKIALDSGSSIEGIVVDRSGRPVPAAKVRIMETVLDLSDGGMSHELQKSREVAADANGNFRLGGLKTMTYHVTGTATGFYSTTRESVPAGTRDVRLELDKAGLVYGYVKDVTNGKPVANFEVRIRRSDFGLDLAGIGAPTESNVVYGDKAAALVNTASGEGLFAIPFSPGRTLHLEVTAEGYAEGTTLELSVPPGDRVMRDIDLTPEIRLSGIVRSPDGTGVPDATVSISEMSAADVEGNFAVRARRVGRAEPGGDLRFEGELPTARTDSEGRFMMRGLRPGDFSVRATHGEWAPSDKASVKLVVGETVDEFELVLNEAGVLAGVAHDADGKPIGGLIVSLQAKQSTAADGMFLAGAAMDIGGAVYDGLDGGPLAAKSNADGTYRIDGIAPGEYYATVKKPANPSGGGSFSMYAFAETSAKPKGVLVKIEAGEETQQDLFVPPTGRVRGTVTEATGAVAGVTVSLKKDGGFFPQAAASAKTDDRGHYELADVEPGEYTLSIKPAGAGIPIERKVDVRARETENEDVRLPTGAIRGQVRDRDTNRGLPNVVIEVKPHRDGAEQAEQRAERRIGMVMISGGTDGGGGVQTMTFGDDEQFVKTDADGNYEVKYLAAGDYDIEIRGGGVSPEKKERVVVTEAKVTEHVTFDAIRGATIVVSAKPADSDDVIQFISVELTSTTEPGESRQEMSGGNTATLDGLKPGTYNVKVSSNGLEGGAMVTVASGESKPVEITLE